MKQMNLKISATCFQKKCLLKQDLDNIFIS